MNPSIFQTITNEFSPSLLHSDFGIVNPLAVTLEIGPPPPEGAGPEPFIRYLATLLHERHHWLQSIGTVAGMFNALLIQVQAGLVPNLPLRELHPSDLPILTNPRFNDSGVIEAWVRLETLRRILTGGRVGSVDPLLKAGYSPHWSSTTAMLKELVGEVLAGNSKTEAFVSGWEESPAEGTLPLLKHNGYLVGIRHIFECGARANEIMKYATHMELAGLDNSSPDGLWSEFPNEGWFDLEYGVVQDLFSETNRLHAGIDMVKLALICDLAANNWYPPLAPASGRFIQGSWTPGAYFLQVCSLVKDYAPDDAIGFNSTDELDRIAREMQDHLSLSGFTATHEQLCDIVAAIVGHVEKYADGLSLYELNDGDIPSPTSGTARTRYLLALSARAFETRRAHPAFFAVPSAFYVADRTEFHKLFDPIGPPLVIYGDHGLSPTSELPGWLEYFTAAGVQEELLRGIMLFDVRRLGLVLTSYTRSVGGSQYGHAIVDRVVQGLFGRSQLAQHLSARLGDAAQKPTV